MVGCTPAGEQEAPTPSLGVGRDIIGKRAKTASFFPIRSDPIRSIRAEGITSFNTVQVNEYSNFVNQYVETSAEA